MTSVFKPHDISAPLDEEQAVKIDENFNTIFDAVQAVDISGDVTVHNGDTVMLTPLMPVYISDPGVDAIVKRAKADSNSTLPVFGLVVNNIAPRQTGLVRQSGLLEGNTKGFNAGDVLYVSAATAGVLTTTKPASPNFVESAGRVLQSAETGLIIIQLGADNEHPTLSTTHSDTLAAAPTSGTVIRSNATPAWARSTFTIPDTYARGDVLVASAANILTALTVGTVGKVLRSDGTDLVYSTFTIPDTGTSGGILGYTAAGTLTSSALLAANQLVLGGGAGATPSTLGSLGTTTTLLHGNAAGAPTFSAVSLTADVTGDLPFANIVQIDTASVLGRNTAGTGDIEVLAQAALTKADDTNVTLTLGGSPTVALVNAASITAGWTGQLAVSRGGTALTTFGGTNTLLYTTAANALSSIATANDGVLITSGAGVPSISSTLPTAVQDTITRLGTVVSGVWNGTALVGTYGGTGITTFGAAQRVPYAASTTALTTSANFVYDGIALYAYHAQGYAASYGYGSGEWQRYSSSSFDTAPSFIGARGRGTRAVPLVVVDGDLLFSINVWGYSGAAATLRKAAEIDVAVDGEPDTAGDTTDMPGRFVFLLSADGTSSVSEVMRINNQGNLFIGNAEAYPTAGSKGLIFGDGTALSGMGLNTAALFANDDGGTVKMYAIDEAGSVALLNYRNIALGAGAAPTLGTIGGSGPTVAEQDSWLEFNIGGTAYWVPAWV